MWAPRVFLGAVSGASEREQTWTLFAVLQSYWNLHVWNRKEVLFLSSVSRYLGLLIVFTSDVLGVGKKKITIEFVASAWSSLWSVAACLSRIDVEGVTVSYVGSWITLTRKTCGRFEHLTRGSFVRVL